MQKNYKKTDAEYKYIAEQLKSLKKMNSANPIKAVKFKDFHEHIYDDYGYCRVCTEEFPIQKVSMRNATYYAAKDDVPIRKRPYSPERTIDSIDKGEAVTVINSGKNAKGNLWYELKDKTWVYSENVSETKPKTTPAKTASKGKFTIKDLVGINDYSILYVRTAEEAEKLFVNAFGKPTSKESFDGPYNGCSVNYDFDFGWGFYASSDFDDPIGRRPHYNMSIDSPSFDGPRGLRVGDTAEKVTATFGKADDTTRDESGKIQRMDYNESFGDWTKGEDNWGATIYFFFDNGRISLIDMNVTGDLSN